MRRLLDLILVFLIGLPLTIPLCMWASSWNGVPGYGSWAPLMIAPLLLAVSRYRFGSMVPGAIAWIVGMGLQSLLALLEGSCSRALAESTGTYWPLAPNGGAAALIVLALGALVLAGCESRMAVRRGWPWLAGLVVISPIIHMAAFSSYPDGILLGGLPCLLSVWALASWLLGRWSSSVLYPPGARWPADGWTVLNSLCGYGSFILSCLTLPLFLPLALILPGGRERWIASAMRRAMRFVFWITPTITWRCEGELAALDSARVVVMNHEGMLDILAACALPGTRTLLAKSWVFNAFPLGVAARAAGLRNSDLLLPEDYQEGVAATLPDPGVGIFVFPEGSRSRSGAIGRFRPGAFVLAKSLGCPVVPVAIAGSRLGIRPGSLWIHPSLVVSRVLPPMTLAADETIRAFAARVRTTIVEARHRLLIDLLATPRMALSRRHVFTGLAPAVRRAVAAEERTGAWRAVLNAPADDGDWLLIGCGWSTIPVTLRQLLPAARIVAWEPAAERRAVARHAWLDSGRDVLVYDALVVPDALTGLVCQGSLADQLVADLLQRALAALPMCVLVAGSLATPSGYAPVPTPVAGWSVFCRV